MLAHGTENREAWLWHRRLGHPSTGNKMDLGRGCCFHDVNFKFRCHPLLLVCNLTGGHVD
ncbi:putative GAG-pre-integrase domain-containing protein [Helianthus annuus]|uniref:GAG-pre-integrase domain-containing protein n=1 Tax=Helianthus annuus TaxID=4232 RepID=A0A251U8A6_HELAN|nr:putative GAG-pre-integrase domain-containing protein [Helianthus annuus]